jgi:hypothetical protein
MQSNGEASLHPDQQQVIAPTYVLFVLHEPWPDFMTLYGTILSEM